MEGLKKNILRATTGACGGARRSHHIRARYRCRAGSVSSAHLLRPGQHTAPAVKPHMRQKGTASTVGGEHLHHVLEVAAGPHHREAGRGAQARRGRQQRGQDHDACPPPHLRSRPCSNSTIVEDPVFSTTIPKPCEVFSSLFANYSEYL